MSCCVITVVPWRVPVSSLFNYMHYFSITMQFTHVIWKQMFWARQCYITKMSQSGHGWWKSIQSYFLIKPATVFWMNHAVTVVHTLVKVDAWNSCRCPLCDRIWRNYSANRSGKVKTFSKSFFLDPAIVSICVCWQSKSLFLGNISKYHFLGISV